MFKILFIAALLNAVLFLRASAVPVNECNLLVASITETDPSGKALPGMDPFNPNGESGEIIFTLDEVSLISGLSLDSDGATYDLFWSPDSMAWLPVFTMVPTYESFPPVPAAKLKITTDGPISNVVFNKCPPL